jgi:LacI family transcriptional regulator
MSVRETTNPKYLQIARQLRAEIAAHYGPGDYLPSERALHRRFGVTVRTIHRALEALTQEGLVETLPYRGTVVLPQAAVVPSGKEAEAITPAEAGTPGTANERRAASKTIALVMPMESYVVAVLARDAERELRRHGYRLQLCGTNPLALIEKDVTAAQAYERMILESLEHDGVAGAIWWSVFGQHNRNTAQRLQAQGLPIVLIDNPVPELACDWIGIDDFGAAFQATRHLLEQGHKIIAYWGFEIGDFLPPVDGERLLGFLEALHQASGAVPGEGPTQPISLTGKTRADLPGLLSPEMLSRIFFYDKDAVDTLLARDPRPTAVVVANDHLAVTFAAEMEQRGVKVPQEMAIVSFGDIERFIGRSSTLTSFHQPFEQMIQRAVRLLLLRLREPNRPVQHVHLPTHLIVRQSSVPVNIASGAGYEEAKPTPVSFLPSASVSTTGF